MSRILVLGAGMVAGPLVRHLLDKEHDLTVTSLILAEADALVAGHPRGRTLQLDMSDDETVSGLVRDSDLVVSLVPYAFHPQVARLCLEHGINAERQVFPDAAHVSDFRFLISARH